MNDFPYFSEIEAHFQRRRGSILMLSTLDWALMETWHEAGIPLEAVLRGIDEAFDKHEAKLRTASRKLRKINGLAWAAQSVLEAAHAAAEAATGVRETRPERDSGFEGRRITAWLRSNAAAVAPVQTEVAERLQTLAAEVEEKQPSLEDLDRTLIVLEEKLFAALLASAPEAELVGLRAEADRELAPYRSRMQAVQIRQLQQQFLQKRLFGSRQLPRLSLFYMPHSDTP